MSLGCILANSGNSGAKLLISAPASGRARGSCSSEAAFTRDASRLRGRYVAQCAQRVQLLSSSEAFGTECVNAVL